MKKILFPTVFISILLLSTCTTSQKQEQILTVSIEPQRYFLEQIVGDKFIVNTLVPSETSPEAYDPPPSVMVAMAKSPLYFKVGDLGFEKAWSKTLVSNNPNTKIIDCSHGISLLANDTRCLHGHIHKEDPHVWSSPKSMLAFTRNIYQAMIEFDIANTSYYTSNFEKLTAHIKATDSIITDILKTASSRSFIIYHPALSYFAHDYNLTQHAIEFEGKSPTPPHLKSLIEKAKREHIRAVFIQRGFDQKNAEIIAQETGAKLFIINPLAYQWDEELIRIAKIITGK